MPAVTSPLHRQHPFTHLAAVATGQIARRRMTTRSAVMPGPAAREARIGGTPSGAPSRLRHNAPLLALPNRSRPEDWRARSVDSGGSVMTLFASGKFDTPRVGACQASAKVSNWATAAGVVWSSSGVANQTLPPAAPGSAARIGLSPMAAC